MATYVNDLRLKEIATGDESGTWGTSTNTNLELIGEALGFGTEAITTNADTHTTTVADGSTDPGRAMYLKYTGTLDSACTITIAPNTISRMQFIENGTSGSQNIIISQGSGANVTIPPGDTKAVYLDGAGSGAAVVDAFASLNTVDLKVEDDLTVTDDATIGGTLGVTGVVTANAGVVVDNITIDGTEIDLSSGDFTLDVAGDIVFDAGGSDITLSDDGTEFGRLKQVSGGMRIQTTASDADMTFMGNDGGSEITAFSLDMSAGGVAGFLSDVGITTGGKRFYIPRASDGAQTASLYSPADSDVRLSGAGSSAGEIQFEASSTSGVTMKVLSSGAVDIGGSESAHANTDDLIVGAYSGNHGIQINAENTGNSSIFFGDNNSTLVGQIEYVHASDYMAFITGLGQRVRFDSDGLKFGSDTAAANALDDYEEGTFVANPTISGGTGAIAFNTTNNHLSYTKIGNVCHVQGTLQIASNSVNGGRLNITNLPFTSQDGDGLGGQTIIQAQISAGSGSQASGYISSIGEGTTTVQIQTYTGVGTTNDSAITMVADSFLLIGGSYLTA